MTQSPFASGDSESTDKPDMGALPEWASLRADFSDIDIDARLSSSSPETVTDTSETPPVPRRRLRVPGRSKHSQKTSQPRRKARSDNGVRRRLLRRWRGGRWMVLVLRSMVALVLIIFVSLGVMRLANPVPISSEEIITGLEQRLDIVDFPVQSGQRLSTMYVEEYFTYTRNERNTSLTALIGENADASLRYAPGSDVVSVQVQQGPYLVDRPEILTDQTAVFTYTAYVQWQIEAEDVENPGDTVVNSSSRWITVAVPVVVSDDAVVSLVSPPSLVPQVSPGAPVPGDRVEVDKEASEQAADYLELYFQQWAAADASSPVSSAYLLDGQSTPAARFGLGGTVELDGIRSFEIPVQNDASMQTSDSRTAEVRLTWRDVLTGSTQQATYRVDVLFRDGYWYVLDIRGGSFTDLG